MALIALMQLLSSTTLVDTNHGDSDGPGRLANTKTKVPIVRIDVAAFLRRLNNLYDWLQDTFIEIAFLKFAEELLFISE
jgi:hypothetical protein